MSVFVTKVATTEIPVKDGVLKLVNGYAYVYADSEKTVYINTKTGEVKAQ